MPALIIILWIAAILGALPTLWRAVKSTLARKISIDTFNAFAVLISFYYGDIKSSAFIVLMLIFAELLDKLTESRAKKALEELLKLKPESALREKNNRIEEIRSDNVALGDILIIKEGSRAPVDGIVTFGQAYLNESSVTGESRPIEKLPGDTILSATLNESGTIKIKATKVGKDSTIERMAALVEEATKHKSHSEKIANRFAEIFLPIVILFAALVYFYTKNIKMVTAIFLVACADDMAVAIPLAMVASLGKAAKNGVIIKGSEWLETLGKVKTIILDKTGTLTYGAFALKSAYISPETNESDFWKSIAVAEKFSEHPVGRAVFKEAVKHAGSAADPEDFKIFKGKGVSAKFHENNIIIGNEDIVRELNIENKKEMEKQLQNYKNEIGTRSIVLINNKFSGLLIVSDIPKVEAKNSLKELKKIGILNIYMYTGDNEKVASSVAKTLGIENVSYGMKPEEKLNGLENLKKQGIVAMVGDGINDAAALAASDVGMAMGKEGSAVAVEAADVVILSDNLSKIPEILMLARKTNSVIKSDMVIWFISNIAGFALVLTGIAGPALAAFYNFATDFLPLINSARLFYNKKYEGK